MDRTALVVRIHTERHVEQRGGHVVIETRRLWLRFAAYYGQPPGSHIGLWRTRTGHLRGLNLRIGKRYAGPCLTVFVHAALQRNRLARIEAT